MHIHCTKENLLVLVDQTVSSLVQAFYVEFPLGLEVWGPLDLHFKETKGPHVTYIFLCEHVCVVNTPGQSWKTK